MPINIASLGFEKDIWKAADKLRCNMYAYRNNGNAKKK